MDEEESELRAAITKAQEENPDEIHCSCVPLLKFRIKELESELAKIKADPSIKAIIDWKEWIDKRPRSQVYED